MNNFIVMAEITQAPQIRYTSDNQTPLAEMQVQIPSLRSEDAPEALKVVAWGSLAHEVQEQYQDGDRVILEGRLGMITVEHPDGFKEKQAELTIQHIHGCSETVSTRKVAPAPAPAAAPAPVAKSRGTTRTTTTAAPVSATKSRATGKRRAPVAAGVAAPAPDYDEIDF